MNETSVRNVRPRTTRKVARIDTAATSNGTRARNDANTKARTASAPAPPIIVSTSTPGPELELPDASWLRPVIATWSPGSARVRTASVTLEYLSAPKDFAGGSNTSANVERPSFVTKRASWVTE